MRIKIPLARLGAVMVVLAFTAVLVVAGGNNGFNVHQKAYYADAARVSFVRPGLVIQVTGAEIAADGTAKAHIKLTDPKGMPLDRLGVVTPGAVSVSFILAYIPKGQTQFVSYTVRSQQSPITGKTEMQAGADSGGTFTDDGNGAYTYSFKTVLPKSYDPAVTHAVGAYGSRNLTEFDMGTYYADTVFNFVPNGSKVVTTRDVIRTETCNKCHDQMAFHGGSRRSLELCNLCHTPQTIDPDTGNTLDMAVFIHKLHAGSSLPSVAAGKKYQIIGHSQTVADYSGINFPADIQNCNACHETNRGATQQAQMNNATRTACGSCHDNVNFATGENHLGLPQTSDRECTTCHKPKGELDFDASIAGAHLIPRFSQNLPGVVLQLNAVKVNKPANTVTVDFSVKDKKGNAVALTDLTRLNLLITGPNSDYAMPGMASGYLSESALKTTGDGNGNFTYTFTKALPEGAKGSYTVAIEGRREVKLLPGTVKEITVRDTGANKQMAFSVDNSPVEKRRQIVSNEKCNACHGSLAFHGDNRNDVMQCGICHNPVMVAGTGAAATTIDFRTMIHRIHTGKEATKAYKIGNSTFDEIGYPGDRRNCGACHVNGSEQLPTAATLPVNDPSAYASVMQPTTAACTGCHDTKAAFSHATINTSPTQGESCAVCHGPSADFAINKVHAR